MYALLMGGVALGLLVAVVLALVIYGVFSALEGAPQSIFMIIMQSLACVLTVQMVYWMHKNARNMKSAIEAEMLKSRENYAWWGALVVILVAIVREGSEIVVFLSAQIMALSSDNIGAFSLEVLVGVIASFVTFYLFILTGRVVSWKKFFSVTGFLLLFLGLSLLMRAVEDIVNLLVESDCVELLPAWTCSELWNSSDILSTSGFVGNLAGSFFAYRDQPTLLNVIVFVLFWLIIAFIFQRSNRYEAQTVKTA